MIINRASSFYLFFLLLLSSCIEKEIPVTPYEIGDIDLHTVGIGSDYFQQVYYSLLSSQVIESNPKTAWCFSLQNHNDSTLISLNSSRYMKIAEIGLDSQTSITEDDLVNLDWSIAPPEGADIHVPYFHLKPNTVYILDLGRKGLNSSIEDYLGYKQFVIPEWSQSSLEFDLHLADLDLQNSTTLNITLDPEGLRSYLSAIDNSVVPIIEPHPDFWDLWFTQYTEVLDGGIEYLVTGILTPTSATKVYQTDYSNWDSLLLADWSSFPFSNNWNEIGWDWKSYSLENGSYTINSDRIYCIKSENGEYLLRFLDFYDEVGATGTFTFECIKR
tara:strand:+ start:463 stop:1452 length:990 start_codon:yes stop_codon:yes gene_type:complete